MEVSATSFKARCLELMDRVAELGKEVVITKRGRPVARLLPMARPPADTSFGAMRGTARALGDLVAPANEVWEAEHEASGP
jgi:prevent-host-death family protein